MYRQLINIILVSLGLYSCSSNQAQTPNKLRFSDSLNYSKIKYAPEPVYNRMKTAYLPSPPPKDSLPSKNTPPILPMVRLMATNQTLDEVGRTLAEKSGYFFYCATPLMNRPVTIDRTGSIEEIALLLARHGNFVATVDHERKEIQFLVGLTTN
jgi:hypothetical protein